MFNIKVQPGSKRNKIDRVNVTTDERGLYYIEIRSKTKYIEYSVIWYDGTMEVTMCDDPDQYTKLHNFTPEYRDKVIITVDSKEIAELSYTVLESIDGLQILLYPREKIGYKNLGHWDNR